MSLYTDDFFFCFSSLGILSNIKLKVLRVLKFPILLGIRVSPWGRLVMSNESLEFDLIIGIRFATKLLDNIISKIGFPILISHFYTESSLSSRKMSTSR